jgi:Ser/Thr protein kinase RdoA (MazF antagonist)
MSQPKAEFASRIAAALGVRVLRISEIAGLGSVNHVFVVETDFGKLVVRFHINPLDNDDYEREAWCLKAAAKVGIPVPEFISKGDLEGNFYIVQSFVEGRNADHIRSKELWQCLGGYARAIAEIPLDSAPNSLFPRFGRDPKANWRRHIDYNLGELNPNDKLIELGVYRPQDQDRIRGLIEWLGPEISSFGLSHGDVVPKNVIVPPDGKPVLIDWGSASVTATPHDAILRMVCDEAEEGFGTDDLEAFAAGYGVSLPQLQPTLHALRLLNRIDLVRWAIGNRVDRIPDTVDKARLEVKMLACL